MWCIDTPVRCFSYVVDFDFNEMEFGDGRIFKNFISFLKSVIWSSGYCEDSSVLEIDMENQAVPLPAGWKLSEAIPFSQFR